MGPTAEIDFAARHPHFADHLRPIAVELENRGHDVGWVDAGAQGQGRVTIVASTADMDVALGVKRRVALAEHGAGQSYSNRHKAHVGGVGRANVELCLLPNEMAKARHDRYWADRTPGVVIGSPRVDFLTSLFPSGMPPIEPPVVACSWHFDASPAKEARGAWKPHGPEMLSVLCEMRDMGWVDLVGHGHPKFIDTLEPFYVERGVKVVRDFEEVCALSDAYLIDNSSTLWEFAALDRPVVVMDSPAYRRNVNHGLRFWDCADVGPRITRPNDLPAALMLALRDPPEVAQQRREIVERVFPHRGEAAARAADAIEGVIGR